MKKNKIEITPANNIIGVQLPVIFPNSCALYCMTLDHNEHTIFIFIFMWPLT